MCLSTVYINDISDDSIIMKNVASIDINNGVVILTDLMERKCTVEGSLKSANLVDGYVILKANKD